MDKEHSNSIKKYKKKNNKNKLISPKNYQNDTEDKFIITTKNELKSKDGSNILEDLSDTYKNLDFLLSNKIQSLRNEHENKQKSSNLIKKQNKSNDVRNLIKQKNSFPIQSVLKSFINRSNTEKSNELSNQSNSILLKKDTSISKDQNSIIHLNKNKKEDSHNEYNIKIEKNPKNIQKKIKLYSNSVSSSCISKNHSPKNIAHQLLFSHENINKNTKNQNLIFLPKFENLIYYSDFQDQNQSQNKLKHYKKIKKSIKKQSKKKLSLSKDNYNSYSDIFQSIKSLKSQTNLTNITPNPKQNKNTSSSSFTLTSQSNKNSILNLKSARNLTPENEIRCRFQLDKKNKFHRKDKKILTFSNYMQEYNNMKTKHKKKKQSKTFLISNKTQRKNLLTILLSNKPNEIKDVNKIMDIITMDEVDKKIKESIYKYDKKKLKKEIHDLETNDICETIEKLPTNHNNLVNNDNKLNYNNIEENNNINESNKTKYKKTKKYVNNYNDLHKTKLMKLNEKYRNLIRKILVYDSLDDEELQEIEINFCYISPNSITVYLIDTIILITSLIQLLYLPIFLAYNSQFCRNVFSFHQLMFYLIDFFYILDLITGFFKAYYNFDEFLIKNKITICKNYLNKWFLLDFIEAIPIYIILNIIENDCKINEIYFSNYYNENINKLQYILLLIKSLKIFKVFSTNTTLKQIKSKLIDNDFFFEYKIVLFTIFIVFSSLNISSCIFIFVGRNSYPGWIIECNMQNNSFAYIYLIAVYYLITSVTTVGYGDIIVTSFKERIYQIIILIVGTCAYSWTISYISNYIKKIHEKSIDFDKKMSILKDIKLTNEHFNSKLYDKIRRYLQYNRVEKKNNNEILINCLPYRLKNTLFMEMYKQIIQNFKIFESFENSNFIVKVVTSFKPVLSIKNDILVQEGDFIDDIIFVKEGVLSLEICIDLDFAQESIEAYLNEKGFGKSTKLNSEKKNIKFKTHLYSCLNSFNSSELKFNEIYSSFSKEKEKIEKTKKYLKVLDIRKNEYYGDVLMFLNERAPLRVKVKSKTAELFYLSKTDAVEISTIYPNIWKRIIKKSIFNMKQIKNLTRKILINFSKLKGIFLNEELCKDISSTDSITSKSNFNDNIQLIEKINKSQKSENKDEESKIQNTINSIISTVIYEEANETFDSILNNSKLKNEITESNKITALNSNITTNKLSTSYSSLKNNIKNKRNILKYRESKQSKFKTETEQTSKNYIIEDSKNSEIKKKEKISICNNINSSSDFSEMKNDCYQIPHESEINNEIYSNEKLNDNKYLQSDFSVNSKNNLEIDKEKDIDKKSIIKCIDNKYNFKVKNGKKFENNSCKKITNFDNLSIVNTTRATINSIYENLNQVTKYRFSRDINLRRKIIQLLMEESNKVSNINSLASNISHKIKINNPFQYSKNYPTTSQNKLKSKNLNYIDEYSSIISHNKEEISGIKDMKSIYHMERNAQNYSKSDSLKNMRTETNKCYVLKKNYSLFKNVNHHNCSKNVYCNQTEKLNEKGKKKDNKKKGFTQNLANEKGDKELNFYGRMKTLRENNNNNIATINNNNNRFPKSPIRRQSYLDMISHNILENRQTLNNPQEFYMDFFTNLVQKKINKEKKFNKSKKDVNTTTKNENVNRNRIRNRRHSSTNIDEEKIKNTRTKKRRATTINGMKQSRRLLY